MSTLIDLTPILPKEGLMSRTNPRFLGNRINDRLYQKCSFFNFLHNFFTYFMLHFILYNFTFYENRNQ